VLTPVERVHILKGADLLRGVGPRHLLGLANVSREIPMYHGDTIYLETDAADALYIVVEGRVRLSAGERTMSEVGPGEAFGTWSLVDDSARGHRAECLDDGLALALSREDFYEVAVADLTILKELVRVLAKRLRELASVAAPEEARVEAEGTEKPEEAAEAEAAEASGAARESTSAMPASTTAGAALAAAAAGKAESEELPESAAPDVPPERGATLDPVIAPEPITAPEPAGAPPPAAPHPPPKKRPS
jgi:CRP-like cAMP-binding protein